MVKISNNSVPEAQYEQNTIPKTVWLFCCILALLGVICQSISIYLPDWREAVPVSKFSYVCITHDLSAYNYMHKGSRRQHIVQETRYGLLHVVYDNNAIKQTWSERVNHIKTKGYLAIQNSAQNQKGNFNNLFVNECPPACREAISSRIRSYENILGYNNLLMMSLTFNCVLATLGVAWYVFFGTSIAIIAGTWLVSGVITLLSTVVWDRFTHEMWKIACRQQMIPFPYLSYCYKITLIGATLIVASAITLIFSNSIYSWRRRRKMEASLNEHLKEKNASEFPNNDFMSFPNLAPMMQMTQQPGFNPSSLFNDIGFGQNQNVQLGPNTSAPNTPSMWARNFQF
ncbi:hypothetical protein BEWA_005470 [Theileria equi strain WA]|uniref:Uncharacterized protein n=1 Tax=Theileria equi strain WA TaxID=1537102 RepID=L0B1Y1_THEEQ|nr:hypothetical protein BEWA_005470 [Theileria equi strain WA]AFZ81139.1 hypothetical protein BEWA_005470 [Theileria equi strain WA]|eukprot:XP_004830805.1 hypothetical protein BEWA_005470 [Theileria equi strain WA]